MNMLKMPNRKGDKIYFHYDYGRGKGQRPSTGIFIYTKPKTQTERNHNKESLAIIDVKKAELTLDQQATGTAYIPAHKFKKNFLDYYAEYVTLNKREGNRHIEGSLRHFKIFLGRDTISPVEITYNLCFRFRRYLLDKFSGDTPANYFSRFKRCVRAATIDGYWRNNPCEDIGAQTNPSRKLKEHLEVDEYLQLLQTPIFNFEVSEAFIFCCYTGLRWIDVRGLQWEQIKGEKLVTWIIQAKTGQPITLTLHSIAKAILTKRLANRKSNDLREKIFKLPSNNGCNKCLQQWVDRAGIQKHITWSCARLSFSILLQDKNVDDATVSYLLGHNTTEQVRKTYKRHRPKNQDQTINQLPFPDILPYFLQL